LIQRDSFVKSLLSLLGTPRPENWALILLFYAILILVVEIEVGDGAELEVMRQVCEAKRLPYALTSALPDILLTTDLEISIV
jgi:hypothetical protein